MPRLIEMLALTGMTMLTACTATATSRPLDSELAYVADPNTPAAPDALSYDVEIVGENGTALPTYSANGRYYVLGDAGERYSIHITNPTAARVEAVVSVDGLDVIDGETADFVSKRGYVINPGGVLRIDGWRTSLHDVAAFRFSSVRTSYAGRKGQPRNVGVIGVALFAERQSPVYNPPVIVGGSRGVDEPADHKSYDLGGGAMDDPMPAPAESRPAGPAGKTTRSAGVAPSLREHSRRPTSRPGLGTAYGERHASSVSWTRFERANPARPSALAELRYNDGAGLAALGIPVNPQTIDAREITRRETAQPFARPPR